jgi:two-component system, OmpR family, osmolarity sensor histidine kinase EnvZ
MNLLPDTMFRRLALMIAGVLLATLVIGFLMLRSYGIGNDGRVYADLIAGNIVAARIFSQSDVYQSKANTAGGPVVMDVETRWQPPLEAIEPILPAQKFTVQHLKEKLGEKTKVLMSGGDKARIWVHSGNPNEPWIGLQVPPFAERTLSLGMVMLFTGFIFVAIAAAAFAYSISKPLEQLARNATALANGSTQRIELRHAPRELRALDAALRDTVEKLHQSAQQRELLLAGVSHDLRTPLARFRLAIELQSQIKQEDRDGLQADVTEMNEIIGQFLDYARTDQQELMQVLDVAELLTSLKQEASLRGFIWQIIVKEKTMLSMSPISLKLALRNLMRNAELHGKAPYSLMCSVLENQSTLIEIRDEGDGVPNELLARLGCPFVRGNPGRNGTTGSGLGLSLVKRVVEKHQGELIFENAVPKGFLVRVYLSNNHQQA